MQIRSAGGNDRRGEPFYYRCPDFGEFWTASLLMEGSILKRYPTGEEIICHAPSLSIYHSHSQHEFSSVGPEHRICSVWVIFMPDKSLWTHTSLVREAPDGWMLDLAEFPKGGEIIQMFLDVRRYWFCAQRFSRELARNSLERAFLLILSQQTAKGKIFDPRVKQAIDLIHSRLGGKFSLDSLADMAHLSPSRFAHLFAEMTGRTLMQYVEHARLEEAKGMLLASDMGISEIAQRLGFNNQFYFSTRFKLFAGQSPLSYRKNGRKGTASF